jgi:arylsulfatase A-like enzyme
MCLQLTELDRELGDFFAVLDSRGIDYAVALTADHGGLDVPERLQTVGVKDATRVDPALSPAPMGAALVKQLGLSGPGLLGTGPSGDFWVDAKLSPADRTRLLNAAVAAYKAHPQVEAVYTAKQIAATPRPKTSPDKWSIRERLRESYYPGRSGDFLVVLKRDVTPIADTTHYVATHGSVWDYDRRVPMIFWRKGMAPVSSDSVVETVDIMPTLASWLSVPAGSVDGRCLSAVASCSR